ncbi:MAG: hypothetical protein ACTSRP_09240 [Candidatus Helarchaeota archaeon]
MIDIIKSQLKGMIYIFHILERSIPMQLSYSPKLSSKKIKSEEYYYSDEIITLL